MLGTVYLVGAGPGDPDLLTVRAARLLRRADVVLHDALAHPGTVALAANAEKIAVGKRCGSTAMTQSAINGLMVAFAQKHAVVVRLKGGDPMLFGRADEELQALRNAGIPFEVVPGITAASAASAALEIPLTRRGVARSVALVTSRCAPGARANGWAEVAAAADAGAIYMGAGTATKIARELIDAGKTHCTRVAVVTNASLAGQDIQFTTLGSLMQGFRIHARGPAVILFGPQFVDPRNVPNQDAATVTPEAWVAA